MLISSDHKENSRPCYVQFALLNRGFPFSFDVEDPETVIRSAASHEGLGQNPVLCKAVCKHHTALNLVPLWIACRAGFALIERDVLKAWYAGIHLPEQMKLSSVVISSF